MRGSGESRLTPRLSNLTANPYMDTSLSELESSLEHAFQRPELLTCALTHRSLAHEQTLANGDEEAAGDNERLEFLGDAVLGLVVAEAMFLLHPEGREGELTRVRSQLVSRQHMAEVAATVDLGRHLRLTKREARTRLRRKGTVLWKPMDAVNCA